MQYLLTEEEYKALHGEGDEEFEALEIENIKLKATLTTFVDKITDTRVLQMAHHFGERHISITLSVDDVPSELLKILKDKYRGSPQDPFRN